MDMPTNLIRKIRGFTQDDPLNQTEFLTVELIN